MTELSPDIQGLLDQSYESDLTEEESEQLLSMCGHGIGPNFSPAAQAVLDAYRSTHLSINNLAAALRAVADQVDYHERLGWTGYGYYTEFQNQILTIAAELDGTNPSESD